MYIYVHYNDRRQVFYDNIFKQLMDITGNTSNVYY